MGVEGLNKWHYFLQSLTGGYQLLLTIHQLLVNNTQQLQNAEECQHIVTVAEVEDETFSGHRLDKCWLTSVTTSYEPWSLCKDKKKAAAAQPRRVLRWAWVCFVAYQYNISFVRGQMFVSHFRSHFAAAHNVAYELIQVKKLYSNTLWNADALYNENVIHRKCMYVQLGNVLHVYRANVSVQALPPATKCVQSQSTAARTVRSPHLSTCHRWTVTACHSINTSGEVKIVLDIMRVKTEETSEALEKTADR